MLRAEDICFSYGNRIVLDGVRLTVAPGEIAAIVGTNGAGKTTLLHILATLAYPLSGRVTADGRDVFAEPMRYRRQLGYLDERAPVDPGLTVKQYLKHRARLKGEQMRKIRHRVQEALEASDIVSFADEPVSRLSVGVRRRVAFSEAVILRPRFLLLDDPFAGVDDASRAHMTETIVSVAGSACVVVTGHTRGDVAPFATQILELADGSIS